MGLCNTCNCVCVCDLPSLMLSKSCSVLVAPAHTRFSLCLPNTHTDGIDGIKEKFIDKCILMQTGLRLGWKPFVSCFSYFWMQFEYIYNAIVF